MGEKYKNIRKELLKLAVPATIGMMVSALYNIVDTIFIGHGVGVEGIGAVAIVFPYQIIINACGSTFGLGGVSVIARAIGRKDQKTVSIVTSFTFIVTLVLGIVLFLFSWFFYEKISLVFGGTKELLPYIKQYLQYVSIGFIFLTPTLALNHLIRAHRKAKESMFGFILSAAVNCILDPLFIFVFHMGMVGAAIATSLSQLVFFCYTIYLFQSGKVGTKIDKKYFKGDKQLTKEIVALGFPSFFRQTYNSFLMVLMNFLLGIYGGTLSLAMYGIVGKLIIMQQFPIFGIGQGLLPLIGYYYGSDDYHSLIETYKLGLKWGTIYNILFACVLVAVPGWILLVFSKNPELLSMGKIVLRIVAPLTCLTAIQTFAGSFSQGIGDAKIATVLTAVKPIAMTIAVLTLLPFLKANAVWVSYPISDLVAGSFCLFMITKQIKKIKKIESKITKVF